jgi:surface carbohydrate biosynthesis protein
MLIKRVGIVVDNPRRDLAGLAEIAARIADFEVEVDLVPMYFCKQYLIGCRPDMVVFNYMRSSNSALIAIAHNLGIRTAVLDTEGGVWVDIADYVKSIGSSNAEPVDLYMTWGSIQETELQKLDPLPAKKILVTGHPRFDRYLNRPPLIQQKEYVLINSNFPTLFPRYESFSSEFKISQSAGGLTEIGASSRFRSVTIAYGRFVQFVSELVVQLPEVNFVLRPHPFESDDRYRLLFGPFKNLRVGSESDIISDLERAYCLLQFDCTTAIEASLVGVPVGSIETCDFGQVRQVLPRLVSVNLSSVPDGIDFIETVKRGSFSSSSNQPTDLLKAYFGPLDGAAGSRIAAAVNEVLLSGGAQSKQLVGLKNRLIFILFRLFGFLPFYCMSLLRGVSLSRIAEKRFMSADVVKSVDREGLAVFDVFGSSLNVLQVPGVVRFSARGLRSGS